MPDTSLAQTSVVAEARDGALYLTSGHPLPTSVPTLSAWLRRWADEAPDRTWLAERSADGWRRLTYGQALPAIEGVASALLERGAGPTAPVALLSGNSIDHALVSFAAAHIGAPAAPISVAYSTLSTDFERLEAVTAALDPAVVFAADPDAIPAALATSGLADLPRIDAAMLEALAQTSPSEAARAAHRATGPDSVAKILFTSGSTGEPRGVVTTQRMLTSNQEALAVGWPFVEQAPPVLVDWLPWSHTFGGSHNVNLALRNGGTLYIDAGRPAPGLFDTSVRNLTEIAPTIYLNVPRGFELLAARLQADDALRRSFFSRVQLLMFAAAALPPAVRAQIEATAAQAGRSDLVFASAWGSTETAPLATQVHFRTPSTANIGVPVPGTEIKLAPVSDRHEIRVRGPGVTPGYWRRGTVVPPPLDDEGFLRTGDAVALAEADRPDRGLVFRGRLGENFKLTSGTWVSVGSLRVAVLDRCGDLVQDVVIAGEGHSFLGLLVFPGPGWADDGPERLAVALARHNAEHPASSEAIRRAVVCHAPLSLDAGETTDKGYTNQRRVLQRRADDVQRLFADPPSAGVIVVG